MSEIKLSWIGLDELKAALKNLPHELTELGLGIVNEAAESAAAEIKDAYPEGETGNLKRGVRIASRRSEFGVYRQVRSTAPHAWIYEHGTVIRTNARGSNRGFSPGHNIFVPVVQRRRREMQEDLTALLEQSGLEVRGR